MKVFIRKTAQGSEYWDNKEKRTLFVPAGKKPGFKVTEDPESMVGDGHNPKVSIADETHPSLDDMTVKELKEYAAKHEIELPSDVTKKDDIISYLSDGE